MSRLALLLMLSTTPASAVVAQSPTPNSQPPAKSSWLVHYGKWAAAAFAIGFTVLGAQEHEKSNDAYGELLDRCRVDATNCGLKPDGTYIDPVEEEMYQSSLSYDRRARVRLIAGQAMLLLCAGLFVADLRHKGPENIPVHGMGILVDRRGRGARVGLQWKF